MKKLLSLIFIFLLSKLSIAAELPIETFLNGQHVTFEVPPLIEKGTALVPLRTIFEALGAKVDFDKATNTILATKASKQTKLVIDENQGYVNGVVTKLSVPAQVINGRTVVPLRFVSEALGANVNWNSITRSITISLAGFKPQLNNLYEVDRVVDGDTIIIYYNGKLERVRFIGINTPETKHPTKGVEPYGKEASAFTTAQLSGKKVNIEFDIQKRDQYGRLLAYIWIGEKFFNAELVKLGYAQVSTFPPNVKYVDLFTGLEKEARQNNRGLWGLD